MSYERFQYGYDHHPWNDESAYDRSYEHLILPPAQGIVPEQFDNAVAYQDALWFDLVRADMEVRRAEADYHPDFIERLPTQEPANTVASAEKSEVPAVRLKHQSEIIRTYEKDGVFIIEMAVELPTEEQLKSVEMFRSMFPFLSR